MTALVCGSYAYDTIMVFDGRFKDQIMPDRVHMLNVAFLVPRLRREFGGTAGNIAYNLKLLGGDGIPMATVGETDFLPYEGWLEEQGIDDRYVRRVPGEYTAQAYITTDMDDNQITAFHPGAMNQSHSQAVPADAGITLGVIAPDGRDGMLQHAEQFAEAGIPFLFDPGQGLPMFNGEELLAFVDKAKWVAVNDYEAGMLEDRTGLDRDALAERVEALIITRGAEGSLILANGETHEVEAVKPEAVNDPTGCGDAYRAGLLFGLMNEFDWLTTGRVASLMGSIKVAEHGTQNHRFDRDEFRARFRKAFGYDFG
ncbi:carbohydrate kinase family protein [Natronospira bacteriovora]|uniref:Carbohydrate kinase family protein n=1 Tax=Natronospira bacteriovora TaxID=3069753 RepID=A0ABU0W9L3_9GAMM|nr:carbohydrate kinase family protein [Natronospira sp. AB-CW4]MDQ2070453.1 carbohydrate kinase family protein [Natronospira sp. AB-CW4]